MTNEDTMVVIFSLEQVRQLKLAHFLKQLGPPALPSGPALAAMMGRFHFLVDGWNDDPQELYSIPEVRRFYQTRSDLSGMDKILPLVRMEIARLVRKIINDQPAIVRWSPSGPATNSRVVLPQTPEWVAQIRACTL